MAEFLLYGLNDDGETAFCELLRDVERESLQAIAHERLANCGAVEVWEGPVCILRLRNGAG